MSAIAKRTRHSLSPISVSVCFLDLHLCLLLVFVFVFSFVFRLLVFEAAPLSLIAFKLFSSRFRC